MSPPEVPPVEVCNSVSIDRWLTGKSKSPGHSALGIEAQKEKVEVMPFERGTITAGLVEVESGRKSNRSQYAAA